MLAGPDQGAGGGLADWVERLLLQLVILGLVALVLAQMLLAAPALRRWLTLADRLEGVDWASLAPPAAASARPAPAAAAPPPAAPAGAPPAAAAPEAARPAGAQPPAGRVTLMLISRRSAPEVRVLVDGRPAGDFRGGQVTVQVRHGQQIAVDGRGVAAPLTFRVVATHGLQAPALGTQLTTAGDQRSLEAARAR